MSRIEEEITGVDMDEVLSKMADLMTRANQEVMKVILNIFSLHIVRFNKK